MGRRWRPATTGDRLWAYLAAALRAATRQADDGPAAPVPDRPPRPDQLELLAAALAAAERPVLLVLDDLHRVADPAALTGLEFLLRHAEQRLRLVVGARAGLPLAAAPAAAGRRTDRDRPGRAGLHRRRGGRPADRARRAAAGRRRCAGCGSAPAAGRPGCGSPRWRCAGSPTRRAGSSSSAATSRTWPATCARRCSPRLDPAARDLLRRSGVAADGLRRPGRRADRPGRRRAGRWPGWPATAGFLRRDDSGPPWYRCHPLLADLLREELGRLPDDELRELHVRAARLVRRQRAARRRRCGTRWPPGSWDRASELFSRAGRSWPGTTGRPPPVRRPRPRRPRRSARDPELALACAAERAYAGDGRPPPATCARPWRRPGRCPRRAGTGSAGWPPRWSSPWPGWPATTGRYAAAAARLLRPPATRDAQREVRAPTTAGGDRREDADVRAVAGTALGLVELAEGTCALPGDRFARGAGRRPARRAGRAPSWSARPFVRCCTRWPRRAAGGRADRPGRRWGCRPARGWSCRAGLRLRLPGAGPGGAAPRPAGGGAPRTWPAAGAGAAAGDATRRVGGSGAAAALVPGRVAARRPAAPEPGGGDRAAGRPGPGGAGDSRSAAGELADRLLAAEADLRATRATWTPPAGCSPTGRGRREPAPVAGGGAGPGGAARR